MEGLTGIRVPFLSAAGWGWSDGEIKIDEPGRSAGVHGSREWVFSRGELELEPWRALLGQLAWSYESSVARWSSSGPPPTPLDILHVKKLYTQ